MGTSRNYIIAMFIPKNTKHIKIAFLQNEKSILSFLFNILYPSTTGLDLRVSYYGKVKTSISFVVLTLWWMSRARFQVTTTKTVTIQGKYWTPVWMKNMHIIFKQSTFSYVFNNNLSWPCGICFILFTT